MEENTTVRQTQTLEEMLGIDMNDPVQLLAIDLVESLAKLKDDLVAVRRANYSREDIAQKLGIAVEKVKQFESYGSDPKLSEIRRYALAVRAELSVSVHPSPRFTETGE